METVIFDLSGIYRRQTFYQGREIRWEDLRQLPGTSCYLDGEAETVLEEKVREGSLFFLDSGNYHYVSYLRLRRIREPFELLMLDHHTDLQPPAFGGILSCGSWLRALLEENPALQRVWLAGPPERDYEENGAEFRDRICFLSEEAMEDPGAFQDYLRQIRPERPLYLSIDKDVLSERDLHCSWDQGNLDAGLLLRELSALAADPAVQIAGVDICGEPEQDCSGRDAAQSDRINERLLGVFL